MFKSPGGRGRLLLMLGYCTCSTALGAQTRFEWQPSVALSELYDDNLFSDIDRPETDRLVRVSAGLGAALRGPRLAARAMYSQDAERYERHPALDSTDARQFGLFDLRYAGARGFEWEATATSTRTRLPGELVPAAGLDLGRRPASQWSTSAAIRWSWGRRTSTRISHSYLADDLTGGLSGTTQLARVSLDRVASPRTRWSLEYAPEQFVSAQSTTLSHGFQLGFQRALSSATDVAVKAGPRFTQFRRAGGSAEPEPEFDLSLRHRFQDGEVGVAVGQGQMRIVGYAGVASAQRARLDLAGNVLKGLRIRFSPAVSRLRLNGSETTAWQVSTEVHCMVTRWVSLIGSHQFANTRGGLAGGGEVAHGVVELRLALARPAARREPGPPADPETEPVS